MFARVTTSGIGSKYGGSLNVSAATVTVNVRGHPTTQTYDTRAEMVKEAPGYKLFLLGGGALSILLATKFGIPVSTTHTITGSIVGVGATQRVSAVRWGIAGRIVWAWILTIPASAGIAALTYLLIHLARGI